MNENTRTLPILPLREAVLGRCDRGMSVLGRGREGFGRSRFHLVAGRPLGQVRREGGHICTTLGGDPPSFRRLAPRGHDLRFERFAARLRSRMGVQERGLRLRGFVQRSLLVLEAS